MKVSVKLNSRDTFEFLTCNTHAHLTKERLSPSIQQFQQSFPRSDAQKMEQPYPR